MSAVAVGLALLSALVHATWNAALRSSADRLWSITVMSFAPAAVALPFIFVFPLPAPASWPCLVLSACLQVGYSVLLAHAYRHGDLTQVYPVVRGSVPLLVTLGGFVLAGQALTTPSLLGVLLVSLAIASLALGGRGISGKAVRTAMLTGLFIASYVTLDAAGVRIAGNPGGYTAWICLLYGALMPVTFIGLRGKLTVDVLSPETRKALAAGLLTLVSYGAMIWAFSLGPAGPLAALRETSVVFAALIGWFFLREAVTVRRLAACLGVALGAFILTYQP